MESPTLLKIGSLYIIHDMARSSAVVPLMQMVRLDSVTLLMYAMIVDSLVFKLFAGDDVGFAVRDVLVAVMVGDVDGTSLAGNVGDAEGAVVGDNEGTTRFGCAETAHLPNPQ